MKRIGSQMSNKAKVEQADVILNTEMPVEQVRLNL